MYTFKSRATGNLIMLSAHVEKIFNIIGKELTPTGIITVDQIDESLKKLKEHIAHEEALNAKVKEVEEDIIGEDREDGENAEASKDKITLKQRAWPLIEMLKTCQQANTDVIWES